MDWREAENFLQSRGVSSVCPACGENELPITPVTQGYLLGVTDEGQLDFVSTGQRRRVGGIRTYVRVCGQCGFLAMHSENVVRQVDV